MICTALEEKAVFYSTCKKWFRRFKNGNFDFHDEGQPKKIKDKELEQFVQQNSCRTQSELVKELGVTRQAISKRL